MLWVDGADTDGPYTHIVKKKAPWKNSIQYAIKQVTVSEYKAEQQLISRVRHAEDNTETE